MMPMILQYIVFLFLKILLIWFAITVIIAVIFLIIGQVLLLFLLFYILLEKKISKLSKLFFNIKNLLTNFFKKHKEFTFFIFFNCLSIVCLIILFWLRVFYKRSPKDLAEFSLILLFVSINILLIYLYLLYKYIKLYKNTKKIQIKNNNLRYILISLKKNTKKIRKLSNYFIKKVFVIFTEITNAFSRLLNILILDPHFYFCFEHLALFLSKYKYKKYLYYIIFIFPRLVFICVFFIEIIWFNCINISYKTFWLLLIPLFGRIFCFTIYECSRLKLDFLSNILIVTPFQEPIQETFYEKTYYDEETQKYYQYKFKSPELIAEYYGIEHLTPLLNQYMRTKFFLKHSEEFYNLDKNNLSIIVNIIIIILTIICWSYVLYSMLCLINWFIFFFILKELLMRIIY